MGAQAKKSRFVRVMRIIGVAVGLLLAFGLALVLVLRSSYGDSLITRYVPSLVNNALAGMGLRLEFDGLRGPLPNRLRLDGIRLYDGEGLWLETRSLEARLTLGGLLRGRIDVSNATLDGLRLYRAPALAENAEDPAAAPQLVPQPAPLTLMPAGLDVDVKYLVVSDAVLGPGLIGLPEEVPVLGFRGNGAAQVGETQAVLTLSLNWADVSRQDARTGRVFAPLNISVSYSDGKANGSLKGSLAPVIRFAAPLLPLEPQGVQALDLVSDLRFGVEIPVLPPTPDQALSAEIEGDLVLQSGQSGYASIPLSIRGGWDGNAPTGLDAGLDVREANAQVDSLLTLEARVRPGLRDLDGSLRLRLADIHALAHTLDAAALPLLPDETAASIRQNLVFAPGGALDVSAEGRGATDLSSLEADVNAALHDTVWPWPQAQAVLGASSELKASIRRDELDPAWRIPELSVQGQKGYLRANGSLRDDRETMPFTLTAEAGLDDVAAVMPAVSPVDPSKLAPPKVPKEPAARTATNATVTPQASPPALQQDAAAAPPVPVIPLFRGAVAAALALDGTLSGAGNGGPTEPVRAHLSLNSPRLDVAVGPTQSVEGLRLEGDAAYTPGSGAFEATLNLGADAVRGAPVQTRIQASGALERMHVIARATLFGLDVAANMRVGLPPGGAVLLDGSATVSVHDWAVLQGFGVPVEAESARADLAASTGGGAQQVTAAITASSLRVTSSPVYLERMDGTARVTDVFGTPAVEADIRAGAGYVGEKPASASLRDGISWTGGRITASMATPEQVGFTAEVDGPLALRAGGRYTVPESALVLERVQLDEQDHGVGLQLVRPATIRLAPDIAVEGLELAVKPGGRITAEGGLRGEAVSLTATVRDLPLGIARIVSDAAPDGVAQADIAVTGSLAAPAGAVSLQLKDVVVQGETLPVTLDATADLAPGSGFSTATVTARMSGPDARPGTGPGTEPGAESAILELQAPISLGGGRDTAGMPLTGTLDWKGRLESIWALVPMPDMRVSGAGMIRARIEGSMNAPRVDLAAYVAGGRFEHLVQGLLLTDIDLEARYNPQETSVVRLRATDGKRGVLAASGELLARSAGAEPRVSVQGAFDSLVPLQRDDLSLTLTGEFGVDGALTAPAVRADVVVNRGEYIILGSPGGSVTTLEVVDAAEARAEATDQSGRDGVGSLDVQVHAARRVFVRGRGLTSEWETDLRVTGPLNNPAVVGSLRPVRGLFELLGKNFNLNEGEVRFTGSTNPLLDLGMTYEGPQITAIAQVKGTARNPQLALTSEPPLPQDEIIAQVLFGKNFSELSRMETLQAANAARDFANLLGGGLGQLGVMDELRGKLGLEVLSFGSTSTQGEREAGRDASTQSRATEGESATTLEAGKYVMDNVYVGVEQGAGADSTGVRVEVELRPNVSVDGKTSSHSSSVGLNWKKDY